MGDLDSSRRHENAVALSEFYLFKKPVNVSQSMLLRLPFRLLRATVFLRWATWIQVVDLRTPWLSLNSICSRRQSMSGQSMLLGLPFRLVHTCNNPSRE